MENKLSSATATTLMQKSFKMWALWLLYRVINKFTTINFILITKRWIISSWVQFTDQCKMHMNRKLSFHEVICTTVPRWMCKKTSGEQNYHVSGMQWCFNGIATFLKRFNVFPLTAFLHLSSFGLKKITLKDTGQLWNYCICYFFSHSFQHIFPECLT